MRIVAGTFRGRRLADVGKGDPAAHLRPTPDRVRESLFNMLRHRDVLDGAKVLDLFAGTGAMGLEALSRGAESAVFVDKGRKAAALIRENIRLTGTEAVTRLIQTDATRLPPTDAPATLVFLDPPYGSDLGLAALEAAAKGGWIAPGALILWEDATARTPPPGFDLLDTRRFGATHISFLERSIE